MKRLAMSVIVLLLLSLSAFSEEMCADIPLGDSPRKGPKDAPVTIVEFLDFQ